MPDSIDVHRVQQDPTVTAGAYTAGDALGELLTFDNVTGISTSSPHNGSLLHNATLVDEASQGIAVAVFLYVSAPSTIADNAAYAPTDADLLLLIASFRISDYETLSTNSVANKTNIGIAIPPTADGKVYVQMMTLGAPTQAATTDIALTLGIVKT